MIDFHCHLDLYPDPHDVAAEAQRRGIGVLSVTTTPSAWQGTSKLAVGRPVIKTAIGLHPQLAAERKHEVGLLELYLPETQFVGEIGLDGSPESRASWADQEFVFDRILRACREAGNKILSIHSRRAADPVMAMLEQLGGTNKPILHWFSGTQNQLKRAIDRDCWFSVGPSMLTGAKGKDLVARMPKNRILLETDGPFTQVRRASAKPWDIEESCELLAGLWGKDLGAVEWQIRHNERILIGMTP
ncbi:Qat anti-phage system TatD family nuclease QatD [Paenarthrobacter sp. NPDC058040]|uniref:Qat anti-phage system TatD family nuclease QatD n=1 Tax=unclassified Paenarthrobacter TaxID=2634190 RepID=UPI0036DDC16D